MSTGMGSTASESLPGVAGAVRKARGLGPSVSMAPATGMGQEQMSRTQDWGGRGTLMGAGHCKLAAGNIAVMFQVGTVSLGEVARLKSCSGRAMELGLNSDPPSATVPACLSRRRQEG